MATTCPRHNNVMQFLEVSKNCQVTWFKSSTFRKKSFFKFCFKRVFKQELKGAILSQNNQRGVARGGSQRGGPGGPGPLNRNAINDKSLTKKALFPHFHLF